MIIRQGCRFVKENVLFVPAKRTKNRLAVAKRRERSLSKMLRDLKKELVPFGDSDIFFHFSGLCPEKTPLRELDRAPLLVLWVLWRLKSQELDIFPKLALV